MTRNISAVVTVLFIYIVLLSMHGLCAVPEYYSILVDPKLPANQDQFSPSPQISPWNPSKSDMIRGFAAYRIDTTDKLTPNWLWNEPRPSGKIDVFVARGTYRAVPLAVRSLHPVSGLKITSTALKNENGAVIPADYIDIRSVAYTSRQIDGKTVWNGTFLQKSIMQQIPADYTLWIWLTFHADSKTKPGLYKGTLKISDSSNNLQKMAVSVLVPDINIEKPKGNFGYYLPGHFYGPTVGIYHNYAEPGHIAQNMPLYFRFLKTRGLNSMTFYHNYPGQKCIDGHPQIDFSDLKAFVSAIKKAGLNGDVCFDMRWIEWWANVAGSRLESLEKEGKSTAGDLGIYGPDGWPAMQYGPEAKRLVAEAAVQLMDMAKKEKWPRVLLLAEEELYEAGKGATFEEFTPVLQKVAPNNTYIVDNEIGYSGQHLDRGEKHNLKIRQYNNWTEEGLAAAKRQNAQVRSYNYGMSRCTWGFLQTRLGSDCHHQWADQWHGDTPETTWVFTQISPMGITTSVPVETSHEGLTDLAYTQTLLSLASKKGPKQSQAAAAMVKNTVADIPVNAMVYHPWLSEISDQEFETRRWEIALAINKLSGNKAYKNAAPGKPEILGTWPVRKEVKKTDKILGAPRISEKMTIDGKREEHCWAYPKNGTGPLSWLWDKESQLLATAGAQDRDKIPLPSSSNAYFAYDTDGLYILVQCNHNTLENAWAKYGDNDPDLWQDDCMEFFFEPQFGSGIYYHLIINVKGSKILIRQNDVIKDSGIKSASIDLNNPSGGYSQEIFIPWKALGQNEVPRQGSAWKINVAREFNSWGQLMSWGRVNSMFSEMDRWGLMTFQGEQGKISVDNLNLGPGFTGTNSISGTLTPDNSFTPVDITLNVVNADGKTVATRNIPADQWSKDPSFSINYEVPYGIDAQTWQMRVNDTTGNILASVALPVKSEKSSVKILKCPAKVISGSPVEAQIRLFVGDVNLKSGDLEGTLTSAGTTVKLPSVKLSVSDYQKVWISTNGLKPGKWTLKLKVHGARGLESTPGASFEVLPSPVS